MSSNSTTWTNPLVLHSKAATTTDLRSPSSANFTLADDDDVRPQSLVVIAGSTTFAIPIDQVRAVVRHGLIVRVPGASVLVQGIVNVRGAIVTVLDLAAMLKLPRAVSPGSIVLIEHGTRLVGLAVSSVRDVRDTVVANTLGSDPSNPRDVDVPLDAAALCGQHLLSSAEIGQ